MHNKLRLARHSCMHFRAEECGGGVKLPMPRRRISHPFRHLIAQHARWTLVAGPNRCPGSYDRPCRTIRASSTMTQSRSKLALAHSSGCNVRSTGRKRGQGSYRHKYHRPPLNSAQSTTKSTRPISWGPRFVARGLHPRASSLGTYWHLRYASFRPHTRLPTPLAP